MIKCHECGMPLIEANEYHPYAACLMFRAFHNSKTVRDNLHDIIAYAMQFQKEETGECDNDKD